MQLDGSKLGPKVGGGFKAEEAIETGSLFGVGVISLIFDMVFFLWLFLLQS